MKDNRLQSKPTQYGHLVIMCSFLVLGESTYIFSKFNLLMHQSMLSPRLGGRATHGKLTERAFPRVGNLTWPPSWKTERNWK